MKSKIIFPELKGKERKDKSPPHIRLIKPLWQAVDRLRKHLAAFLTVLCKLSCGHTRVRRFVCPITWPLDGRYSHQPARGASPTRYKLPPTHLILIVNWTPWTPDIRLQSNFQPRIFKKPLIEPKFLNFAGPACHTLLYVTSRKIPKVCWSDSFFGSIFRSLVLAFHCIT